jgi:hypothetical protein
MVDGQKSMVNRRWSMVKKFNRQSSMVDGQKSKINGQWSKNSIVKNHRHQPMHKVLCLLFLLAFVTNAFSQNVKISIAAPAVLNGRKAILLTREKGFAAVVHSIKLGFDTTHLQMDRNLVPDLYQLQVSQMKGSLTFFFDSGTQVRLDTADVSKSVVTHSKSNPEWQMYWDSIQQPSDARLNAYAVKEVRARKKNQTDSLNYWVAQQDFERQEVLSKTGKFIFDHPHSYVSLYLLKNNWYAFKNQGLFEHMDPALAHHKNYKLLKEKRRLVKTSVTELIPSGTKF